jgi:hypothetical protein
MNKSRFVAAVAAASLTIGAGLVVAQTESNEVVTPAGRVTTGVPAEQIDHTNNRMLNNSNYSNNNSGGRTSRVAATEPAPVLAETPAAPVAAAEPAPAPVAEAPAEAPQAAALPADSAPRDADGTLLARADRG